MEGGSICSVCCVPFTSANLRRKAGDFLGVQKLLENVEGEEETGSAKWEELVCGSCLKLLSGAVEGREKVSGVEDRVRELQGEILRMKRKLVKMLGELEEALEYFRSARAALDDILEESRGRVGMLDELCGKELRHRILIVMQGLSAFTYDAQVKWERPQMDEMVGLSTETSADELTSSPGARTMEEWEGSPPSNRRKRMVSNRDRTASSRKRRRKDDETSGSATEEAPVKMTKYRQEKISAAQQKAVLDRMDRSGMSPFKVKLITSVVKQNLREEKKVEQQKDLDPDPLDFIKNYRMTYDPAQDKLLLGGIQLEIDDQLERIVCCECGVTFPTSTSNRDMSYRKPVYSHVLGVHLNLFQCPHCPSKLGNFNRFREHVLGHGGKFGCDICGMPTFKCNAALKKHRWSHLSQAEKEEAIRNGARDISDKAKYAKLKQAGGLQCVTCGKSFVTGSDLRRHERTHQKNLVTCVCSHCGKGFKEKSALNTHLRLWCPLAKDPEQREMEYRYQCKVCLKKFPFPGELSNHKQTVHEEARPFQCGECKMTFKLEKNLKVHLKRHSGLRPFPCPKCGVAFKTKQHRSKHEKNCEGESAVLKQEPDNLNDEK